MQIKEACRSISELTPPAQQACGLFLKRCEQKGLKVRITETYRSQERQNYLYEQGRTRSGKVVTWTKNSRHTSRRAWDICKDVKGQEYSDSAFFKACGAIAKSLGIIWGGTWKQADTPHFEITADWQLAEGVDDTDYTSEIKFIKETLDKLGDRLTRLENPLVFDYVDKNMPEWARETVTKLTSKKIIRGGSDGELGLNYDMLRLLTILDRARVFD